MLVAADTKTTGPLKSDIDAIKNFQPNFLFLFFFHLPLLFLYFPHNQKHPPLFLVCNKRERDRERERERERGLEEEEK